MQLILHIVSAITLLYVSPSLIAADGCQAGNCINGFMSRDRMDAALNKLKYERIPTTDNFQGLFPGMKFTCNGTIQSWIFGAAWNDTNEDSFPQLQIWRPMGNRSYTRVGNTTINTTYKSSQFYRHQSSSPLTFQTGDILGYYQPNVSTNKLYMEKNDGGPLGYIIYNVTGTSVPRQIVINNSVETTTGQLVIGVVTDPSDCGCGFMSKEKIMMILWGTEIVHRRLCYTIRSVPTQQITPDMTFTCNGIITKWIFAAVAGPMRNDAYSEFQLWRNTGSDMYQKINGTFIQIEEPKQSLPIHEYDAFPPIPFQAGDILGVFLPQSQPILLYCENTRSHTIYYEDTQSERVFALNNTSVKSTRYHLMVSVEISITTPVSTSQIMASDFMSSVETLTTSSTDSLIATSKNASLFISVSPSHPSDIGRGESSNIGIGGGIAAAVLLLVTIAIVVVLALVCAMKQSKKTVVVQDKKKNNEKFHVNSVRNKKTAVDVQYKEQSNKESVENFIYGVRNKKAAVDLQYKEQTNKESVENLIYGGS